MVQPFPWRDGEEAAVSLSFDDARLTQPDIALPLFRQYGVRGTFYVQMDQVRQRLEAWRQAVREGQEIGNHTVTHPCSANHPWVKRGLESFTLEEMEQELTQANEQIEEELGVRPRTFAYPCGQTFVGRGVDRRSYVPMVARLFEAGRGYLWTTDADPRRCDLACLPARDLDRRSWREVEEWLAYARKHRRWLIFVSHEVGTEDRWQTTQVDVLRRLCEYCLDRKNRIWLDTIAAVGEHVRRHQPGAASRQIPSPV